MAFPFSLLHLPVVVLAPQSEHPEDQEEEAGDHVYPVRGEEVGYEPAHHDAGAVHEGEGGECPDEDLLGLVLHGEGDDCDVGLVAELH